MKRTTLGRAAIPAAVALSLSLAACGAANESTSNDASGSGSGSSLSGTLDGAGASTQTVAMETWKAKFEGEHPDVTVNYDPIGSGGGREQFLSGATQFGGSDAYLTEDELSQVKDSCGQAIEFPVYISPIALAYNLKGVTDLKLDPTTVAKIFTCELTSWDDPAIKKLNPGTDLPSTKVTPVHRSDDSGTTENFTDYLHKAAGDVWTNEMSGNWPIKSGESAKGTQGVIQAVGAGDGYIGYADASQLGDLPAAQVKVGSGFVGPTAEAAAKIVDESSRVPGRGKDDYAIDLKRTTDAAGTYPIVLASYSLACTTYPDQGTADLVKAWLSYISSSEGQQAAAKAAGSAPLSQSGMDNATKAIDAISAG